MLGPHLRIYSDPERHRYGLVGYSTLFTTGYRVDARLPPEKNSTKHPVPRPQQRGQFGAEMKSGCVGSPRENVMRF
jgi:hypothetical protein